MRITFTANGTWRDPAPLQPCGLVAAAWLRCVLTLWLAMFAGYGVSAADAVNEQSERTRKLRGQETEACRGQTISKPNRYCRALRNQVMLSELKDYFAALRDAVGYAESTSSAQPSNAPESTTLAGSMNRLTHLLGDTNTALSRLEQALSNPLWPVPGGRLTEIERGLNATADEVKQLVELARQCRDCRREDKCVPTCPPGAEKLNGPSADEIAKALQPSLERIEGAIKQLAEDPGRVDGDGVVKALESLLNGLARRIGEKTNTPIAIAPLPAPSRQIAPFADLRDVYGDNTAIEYVLAGLPDPRVPRHRRSYELALDAIGASMLTKQFVLDRYYMPWQDYVDNSAGKSGSSQDCQQLAITKLTEPHFNAVEACFGVLVFRRDDWRHGARTVTLRVVYVLPETTTFGVMPGALIQARQRIAKQFEPARGPMVALTHPRCDATKAGQASLLILGPAFSNSVSSYAIALAGLYDSPPTTPPATMCLLAYSATSFENQEIDRAWTAPGHLQYAALTVSDQAKRHAIFAMADELGVTAAEVAFLSEATTFGGGICPESDSRCRESTVMQFSPNIAEIRSRRAQSAAAKAGSGVDALRVMRAGGTVLSADDGDNNGSEYPTSRQATLSIISAELALDHSIRELAHSAHPPRIVVVGATEVRDRLYLFDKVRRQLPTALMVDMELDELLSHPDYLHATRGMLQLGSATLRSNSCSGSSCTAATRQDWLTYSAQTDVQMLLYQAMRDLIPGRPSARGSARANPANTSASCAARGGLAERCCTAISTTPDNPTVYVHVVGRLGSAVLRTMASDESAVPTCAAAGAANGPRAAGAKLQSYLAIIVVFLGMLIWLRARLTKAGLCPTSAPEGPSRYLCKAVDLISLLGFTQFIVDGVAKLAGDFGKSRAFSGNAAWGKFGYFLGLGVAAVLAVRLLHSPVVDAVIVAIALAVTIASVRRVARMRSGYATAEPGVPVSSILTFGMSVLRWAFICIVVGTLVSARQDVSWGYSAASGVSIATPALAFLMFATLATFSLHTVHEVATEIAGAWSTIRSQITLYDDGDGAGIVGVPVLGLAFALCPPLYALIGAVPLGFTPFGHWLDCGFFLALMSTAVLGCGALYRAIDAYERLQRASAMLRWLVRVRVAGTEADDVRTRAALTREWNRRGLVVLDFVSTPALVVPLRQRGGGLSAYLPSALAALVTNQDTVETRCALRELLAQHVWVIRQYLQVSIASSFMALVLAYCYPVPGRDGLLLIAMVILVVGSAASTAFTINLERDAILSRLLCNSGKRTRWSYSLVATTALPFLWLAVGFLINEVPGMREMAGSFIEPLLRKFGVG